MSIFYLIPWKNDSVRLPYKNHLLLDFTLDYLRAEKVDFTKVFTFGKDCPNLENIKHIKLEDWEDASHIQALQHTILRLAPKPQDIIVQLQLTQPLRRAGLLSDAVQLAAKSKYSVISCTSVDADARLIDDDGIIDCGNNTLRVYDGAIYAGRVDNWQDWFDRGAPHEVVINQQYSVCDIDTIDDLQKHIIFY